MEKSEIAKSWALERVGCPYIYGGTGQVCTPAYRQARAAQYPNYAVKIERNCPRLSGSAASCKNCRWADPETGRGKPAYDCAQLARWCMAAVGVTLVSGANSQWIKTAWAEKGEIAALPRDRLCLVYRRDGTRMGHVGIYLGDGTVVHAKGHDYGVVQQDLAACDFTHWGIPEGLYSGEWVPELLKKGSSGEAVRQLQEMLLRVGMLLPRYGADGKYGNETAAAVLTFQAGHGLPETGECDAATWRALAQACAPDDSTDDPTPVQPETPPQAPESGSTAILPPDCEAVPRLKLMEVRACLQNALNIIDNALGSGPVG